MPIIQVKQFRFQKKEGSQPEMRGIDALNEFLYNIDAQLILKIETIVHKDTIVYIVHYLTEL